MIVKCDKCATKFRIADEKVKPSGSKVRCSRCAHVFVVRRSQGLSGPAGEPQFDGSDQQSTVRMGPEASERQATVRSAVPPQTPGARSAIPAAQTTQEAISALGFGTGSKLPPIPSSTTMTGSNAPSIRPNVAIGESPTAVGSAPPPPPLSPPSSAPYESEPPTIASNSQPPSQTPASERDPFHDVGFPEARWGADNPTDPGSTPNAEPISDDPFASLEIDHVPPSPVIPSFPGPGSAGVPQSNPNGTLTGVNFPPPADFPPPENLSAPAPEAAAPVAFGPPTAMHVDPYAADAFPPPPDGGFSPPPPPPAQNGAGGSDGLFTSSFDLSIDSGDVGGAPFAGPPPDTGPPTAASGVPAEAASAEESSELASSLLGNDHESNDILSMPTADTPLSRIPLGKAAVPTLFQGSLQNTTAVAAYVDEGDSVVPVPLDPLEKRRSQWPTLLGVLAGLMIAAFVYPGFIDRLLGPLGAEQSEVSSDGMIAGSLRVIEAKHTKVSMYPSRRGELLVVAGSATNKGAVPFAQVEAVALVLDGDQVVARERSLVGVSIPVETLSELEEPGALNAAYEISRNEMPAEQLAMKPGQTRKFMIVFRQIPEGARARDYRVEFVSKTPVETANRDVTP